MEDWIKVSPAEGAGNGKVTVTVGEHTGSEARSAEQRRHDGM
ncbi:MAG: hypothetical protein LUC49_03530 [Prevotella sp.]|nr:hypothetical protein [Prevotella sp.]